MMKMVVEISGRKAKVTYPQRMHEERMNGLIQYLSEFCTNIEYEVRD